MSAPNCDVELRICSPQAASVLSICWHWKRLKPIKLSRMPTIVVYEDERIAGVFDASNFNPKLFTKGEIRAQIERFLQYEARA